jgi:hypothetical protein
LCIASVVFFTPQPDRLSLRVPSPEVLVGFASSHAVLPRVPAYSLATAGAASNQAAHVLHARAAFRRHDLAPTYFATEGLARRAIPRPLSFTSDPRVQACAPDDDRHPQTGAAGGGKQGRLHARRDLVAGEGEPQRFLVRQEREAAYHGIPISLLDVGRAWRRDFPS